MEENNYVFYIVKSQIAKKDFQTDITASFRKKRFTFLNLHI